MDTKNVVVLVGRLTADPELRYTAGGDAVVNFAIAVNRLVRNSQGEFEEKLDGFFNCHHFGDTAVKFAEEFKKGALVQITGSLHQSKFTPKGSEREISKIEVRVNTIGPVLFVPKSRTETPATEASMPAEAQPTQLQPA
jgi:single-strand DNA-binding protein